MSKRNIRNLEGQVWRWMFAAAWGILTGTWREESPLLPFVSTIRCGWTGSEPTRTPLNTHQMKHPGPCWKKRRRTKNHLLGYFYWFGPLGRFSQVKSRCPSVVCLCVCAVAETPLLDGLETSGKRGYRLYWHTSRHFMFLLFQWFFVNQLFCVFCLLCLCKRSCSHMDIMPKLFTISKTSNLHKNFFLCAR